MKKDYTARLEKFYREATETAIDVQGLYEKSMVVVDRLVDNLAQRIVAHERTSKGGALPASMQSEIETLGRIIGTLESTKFDSFRKGDQNAGAVEICRILGLARQKYGRDEVNAKGEESKTTAEEGASQAPKEDAGQEDAGGENRQYATPEGSYKPTTDFHRRHIVRVDRRGSR